MNRRRFEVVSLCVGNAVGYAGSGVIPVWIAAMIKAGPLSAAQVAYLATAELTLITITVMISSAWVSWMGPRRFAVLAGSIIVIANSLAAVPAVSTVMAGRLLSAVGMGALLAVVTGVALQRQDAQRALALMQTAMMALVSLVYFLSATIIGRFGPPGIFGFLVLAGLIVIGTSLTGLPRTLAVRTTAIPKAGTPRLPAFLGALALAGVCMGQGLIWVHIVVIGNGLRIAPHALGAVLALVTPLAMLGSLAAHRFGERWGLLWPLLIGLAVLAADPPFLVTANGSLGFAVSAALLNTALLFSFPYAIALLDRIDLSGRLAGSAPAFIMLGGALSPFVGGKMIELRGFHGLAGTASLLIGASALTWLVAAALGGVRLSLRSSPVPKWS